MDPDELEALGLYDPAGPDADERRALLALALEHGATIDEIHAAIDGSRLHALAVERLLLPHTPNLTLGEVANTAKVTREFATRVWRALGFALPADDAVACTETDVATGHLGPDQTQRLGHRSVAGFDDPVEVYALKR
jgi:hypothetical protein